MSLKLIMGVPKTGKSTRIYESIKNDILNNKNVILFVPSFMKVKAEEEYIEFLGASGLIGVNITTIQDYIEGFLEKFDYNLSSKYLSDIDKKLILSRLIKEEKKLFNVFSKVTNKQGFINNLVIYMDLIRKSDLELDTEVFDAKNNLLNAKLTELVNIYKKYEEKIRSEYVDFAEETKIFVNEVFFKDVDTSNLKIYFDGYNNFNKSEYEFIEKILEKKIDTTLSLCTDITSKDDIYLENTMEIFRTVNKTYLKLLKIANKKGANVENIFLDKVYSKSKEDIAFLTENLFKASPKVYKGSSENISLSLVTNPYAEIESIAHIIKKKVKEGYRYNDFLIYTTSIDEYDSILRRCFYEYQIPVYSSITYSMFDSVLVDYINYLLLIAKEGVRKENVIGILKLGLNDIDNLDICTLENYLTEFNIYNLENEFVQNNLGSNDYVYDLQHLNDLRKNVISIFASIQSLGSSTHNLDFIIRKIYEHLVDFNVLRNYEIIINRLKLSKNNQISEKIAVEDQVWENLMKIFLSLKKMLSGEEVSISYILEIFSMLLDSIKLKNIPRTMDEVELADINAHSSEVKKVVFFVGVNENKFPNISEEDILFKDSELETLESRGMFLKETVIDKEKMVEYNIYKALSNVEDKLYVFVPSSDINLKTLRKSSMVSNIEHITGLKLIGSVTAKKENVNLLDIEEMSKDEAFEGVIATAMMGSTKEDIKKLYKYFKEDKTYKEVLDYRKNDDNLEGASIDKLFGNELVTSVSRLELFKKCPFSYFMNYSLGLKERKEFSISSLDIGSFMHEVLEEFSMYLFKNDVAWHSLVIEEEFEKIEGVLEEIVYKKINKVLIRNEANIRFIMLKNRLLATMKKVILVIAESFNQSYFVPKGYEITFDKNGVFAPIRLKLDNDSYMNIIGKIDRVDTFKAEDREYVRIVDYKSSARSLDISDIKEGISLQLVTYLSAYIKNSSNEKKLIPSGMLYFNLSDKLTNMKEFSSNEAEIKKELAKKLRLNGIFISDINVLEKMDKKFNTSDSLIDISSRSLNGKKALSEEDYLSLLDEVEGILKEIGREIIKGTVKISPNKKADYCKFCKYSNVCRKDICL